MDGDDDSDCVAARMRVLRGRGGMMPVPDTTLSAGKTVAITRAAEDAAEFVEMARGKGMRTFALPTIQLVSKGDAIAEEFLDSVSRDDPDYVVFMSSKAVRLLFGAARGGDPLKASTYDRLRLVVANMTVVAVGPKTRDALEREGIKVNKMPLRTYSSVGVGELFTELGAVGKKVIVPRSGASTPFLKELLDKIGLAVTELYLYDVRAFPDASAAWDGFRRELAGGGVDGIVFTSASSVRGFMEIMSRSSKREALLHDLARTTTVAIGPFTADEMRREGIRIDATAATHTVAGAFEELSGRLDI